jgi:hypothetical protein
MSLEKNWTFGTITFARRVSDEFPRWFAQGVAYQTDSVLDGSTRYLDRGGRTIEPLAIQADTDSEADRDALLALRGQTKQLTSPKGYTVTAILTKAVPIYRGPRMHGVDLEFEVTF